MFSIILSLNQSFTVAVLEIPKCGSETARRHSKVRRPLEDYRKIDFPKIAFIRDPLERLKSCFSFFIHRHPNSLPENARTYNKFIDLVINDPSADEHYKPQVEFLKKDGVPIVDKIYKLDKMTEVLEKHIGYKVNREHQEVHTLDSEEYRKEELNKIYSKDLEVFYGLS